MNKFWSLLFLFLINCAVSTAQNFHFKGLDLDTGANLVRNVSFDKQTKNIVLTSSSLLWHRLDSFERYKMNNYFVKLDSNSLAIFNKKFQKNNINTRIRGNIKLKQGNYIAYGYEYNTKLQAQGVEGVPGYIVKYSSNGDTIKSKYFYYQNGNSPISSIRELNDSNIILISLITNDQYLFSALRVIKLDTLFNTLFDSVYYYCDYTTPHLPQVLSFHDAVVEDSNGDILIGTYVYTRTESIFNHGLLFKINKNGAPLWQNRYEFERDKETEINKIIKLQDGNFMLVGYYEEFWKDPKIKDKIFLIKVSSTGELISKKLIHAYESHYILDALVKSNGDILLAGAFSKFSGDTKSKAGLMCLNSRGDIKWHRQYELPSNMLHTQFESSNLADIEIADDGTIMAVGNISVIDSTIPYNNGGVQDLIFLYTDSNGCVDPSNCTFTTVEEDPVMPLYFQVYPNPSHGQINFSTNINSASSASIKIYNNLGQLLFEKEITNFTEEVDISKLPRGMYILELESKEFRNTQKLLIE